MSEQGWIGVDFDGTLAMYHGWEGAQQVGNPIMPMVDRVREWLAAGEYVRIFTARVYPLLFVPAGVSPYRIPPWEGAAASISRTEVCIASVMAIRQFCFEQWGKELDITCVKDYHMKELWDDRCVRVETNSGRRIV